MTNIITISPYPDLKAAVFETEFPKPLSEMPSPAWLVDLLRLDAAAPVSRSEELRQAVRDLLRHKGYKPTGRGKPASEYLVRAAENDKLGSINLAVDACNAISLHSGFPISVVDLEKVQKPHSIKPGEAGDSYVFNASGQEISVAGLLCLHDAAGPCANAVRDSHRTKTSDATTRTLSIIWGVQTFSDELRSTLDWYQEILENAECRVQNLERFRVAD